jgi:HSP20 family molecular chaperone IbpA
MERLEKSIEVHCPLRTVYNQWTQFEELPRFMEDIEEVRQLDDTHLHWRASVNGKDKEWQAEITEQVPDQRISWRSTNGATNTGTVRFEPIDAERTRVRVAMAYEPEGFTESLGDALGVVSRHVEKSLENFKEFVEQRGTETGAWRGEVRDGEETRSSREGAAKEAGRPIDATRRDETRRGREAGDIGRRRGERPARMAPYGGWNEPFSVMRRVMEDMDRVFGGFGSSSRDAGRRGDQEQTLWSPRVDVSQRGDELIVTADLPGVKKEDLSVEIEDDRLILQGERRSDRESREGGSFRSECEYGSFYRVVPLPEAADASSARATMDQGVLTVTLKAPQPQRGRRLQIDSM